MFGDDLVYIERQHWQDGDVIILHGPIDTESLEGFRTALHEKGLSNLLLISVGDDDSWVEHLDEESMNARGWFKGTPIVRN